MTRTALILCFLIVGLAAYSYADQPQSIRLQCAGTRARYIAGARAYCSSALLYDYLSLHTAKSIHYRFENDKSFKDFRRKISSKLAPHYFDGSIATGATETHRGTFSQYAQLPTDATLAYRISTGEVDVDDLTGAAGVVALASCDYIGDTVWIRFEDYGGGRWLRVVVFDCSGHSETTKWMEENDILGEIGFHLAQELGIEGGAIGELSFYSP